MVSPSEDTPEEEDLTAELDAISSDVEDGGEEADSMASEWEAMLGGDDDDMGGGLDAA